MDTLNIYASVSSDKGHVRANNEDNIFFNGIYLTPDNRDEGIHLSEFPRGEFLLYAVYDGMGGAAFGEEASYIASEVTGRFYSQMSGSIPANVDEFVISLIKEANAKICEKMRELNSGRMGATLAMVAVYNGKAKVYNVGDSRVYLWRNSNLVQISLDDSFAQRLYRMGVITPEEAAVHKDRNKLVQHLGIEENELAIEPHISEEIDLRGGDRILICSDGLSDMVDGLKINEILCGTSEINELCEELVCEALRNGGRDNISVILLEAQALSTVQEVPAAEGKSYVKHIVFAALAAVVALAALIFVCFNYFDLSMVFDKEPKIESAQEQAPLAVKEKQKHQSTILLIVNREFDIKRISSEAGFDMEDTMYSSQDENVVSVTQDGIMTGIEPGSAVVIIEDDDHILEVSVDVVEGGSSTGAGVPDKKEKNKKKKD